MFFNSLRWVSSCDTAGQREIPRRPRMLKKWVTKICSFFRRGIWWVFRKVLILGRLSIGLTVIIWNFWKNVKILVKKPSNTTRQLFGVSKSDILICQNTELEGWLTFLWSTAWSYAIVMKMQFSKHEKMKILLKNVEKCVFFWKFTKKLQIFCGFSRIV